MTVVVRSHDPYSILPGFSAGIWRSVLYTNLVSFLASANVSVNDRFKVQDWIMGEVLRAALY